jgi:hypothetical protein
MGHATLGFLSNWVQELSFAEAIHVDKSHPDSGTVCGVKAMEEFAPQAIMIHPSRAFGATVLFTDS